MIIHYTYINNYPIPIFYSHNDPRHIWVNMNMKGFLTPGIVRNHMLYLLDNNVPEGLVEAILAYPEDQQYMKDVTVVFEAGS